MRDWRGIKAAIGDRVFYVTKVARDAMQRIQDGAKTTSSLDSI
jgi:hypothetical protein